MYKVGGGGRAQKKSEAVGRRLGAGPAWLFLRSSGVLSTLHLGFCRGSKGTREEPSGLSSRLRSDFLNSAGGRETTSSAIPSTPFPHLPPPPPGQPASLPVPHPLSCCWSGQRSPSWSPKAKLDWTVGRKKKKRQLPVTTEGSHHYVAGWWPNRLAANEGGFRD